MVDDPPPKSKSPPWLNVLMAILCTVLVGMFVAIMTSVFFCNRKRDDDGFSDSLTKITGGRERANCLTLCSNAQVTCSDPCTTFEDPQACKESCAKSYQECVRVCGPAKPR